MKRQLILTTFFTLALTLTPFTSVGAVKLPTDNPHKQSCNKASEGYASCNAHVIYDKKGSTPLATTSFVNGYTPSDLVRAYKLPALPTGTFVPNGQTVAIVDAYDNPNAASDLVVYRKQFNLPLCETTNPNPTTEELTSCFFTKVNQNGQASPLPTPNIGWGQEIDLDIDMVSAVCPSCKILLVEANSNSFSDLGIAVDRAVTMGANVVSNSYGGSEFRNETSTTYANHYKHPGVAITVSTGDNGYGVQFPSSSPYVTAVGGTSLLPANNSRGWNETAWSGAGSGCSNYVAALSWQTKIGTCSKRVVSDVSAIADPNTGVAIYDSYGSTGGANWYVFGGTSVAAPIIGSIYALAGNVGSSNSVIQYGEYPYAHRSGLFDITSGSNGSCTNRRTIGNLPLCTAGIGFDGPTGLGSPNGLTAF